MKLESTKLMTEPNISMASFSIDPDNIAVSNKDVVLKITLVNKGNREGAGIKAVPDSYQEQCLNCDRQS